MKFSELVTNTTTADKALVDAKAAVLAAQTSDDAMHTQVVAALHGAPHNEVALAQADGSVLLYELTSDGGAYEVRPVQGDFDLPAPPPPPAP
jgi:hypothetical protein